ncbi:MAG TPA: hypothetical protein VNK23_04885 [Candidatus Dormibacteraeota bacterium]|nr:hypothetical protein [Candidatus Dormibacteraeota bacterium]
MKRSSLSIAIALAALLTAGVARADKFKLKDGSIIVGTVVGYEGNAFKVKTSYGFALVEKDKIVSIQISSSPQSSPSEGKTKTEAQKAAASRNHASTTSAEADARASASRATTKRLATAQSISPATPSASAASPSAGSQTAQPASSTSTVPQAGVSTAVQPQPIREKVTGNTYVNDTYEFQMYKPPDWQVMDGARSVLPGAIAAMGTDDQSTYLVIGQEPEGKSATADVAAMEQRLGDILVNYRPLDDQHLTVAGSPVIAHHFRGGMDEHDWSGFMVFLPHSGKLYTIFGMTRADNDLVQIQENVIRRTISSFQFLPQ